jgi:flagellar basal-body rod protein FlgG
MLANSKKMDSISNNLANVNTNAFKKDTVVFESFPELLAKRINDSGSSLNPSGNVGNMELGSDVGEIFTYYSQGQLVNSGDKLDMALQNSDSAFFTVGMPDQQGNTKEYYTRDGAFTLDSGGRLVTKEGYPVMGENGPIFFGSDDFIIENDGTIVQNEQVVDRLRIREFTDTSALSKYGSNLVEASGAAGEREFTGTVVQGFVEQSNVNVVREMVDMITVMRAYEASQKILLAQDGTLEKAVNEVGVVR